MNTSGFLLCLKVEEVENCMMTKGKAPVRFLQHFEFYLKLYTWFCVQCYGLLERSADCEAISSVQFDAGD